MSPLKALSHSNVHEKVAECSRALEVRVEALDGRCRTLVVVEQRRGRTRRVFDEFKICNNCMFLQTLCERSRRWMVVKGRWGSGWEHRRAHDGQWKPSECPRNVPQASSYSIPFFLRFANVLVGLCQCSFASTHRSHLRRPSADLNVPLGYRPTRPSTVLLDGKKGDPSELLLIFSHEFNQHME